MKSRLDERMPVDPMGITEPVEPECHVSALEKLVLKRKCETLHRVSGKDAAHAGNYQIQDAVENGLRGFDNAGLRRALAYDVENQDADDQQDNIWQGREGEFRGYRSDCSDRQQRKCHQIRSTRDRAEAGSNGDAAILSRNQTGGHCTMPKGRRRLRFCWRPLG